MAWFFFFFFYLFRYFIHWFYSFHCLSFSFLSDADLRKGTLCPFCVPIHKNKNKVVVLFLIVYCTSRAEPVMAVDMRPLPKEPESEKKKHKGHKGGKRHKDDKPNISYPTNFEHTIHVGFDACTGEFTVSFFSFMLFLLSFNLIKHLFIYFSFIFCFFY